jgi:type II restriction enzyme
MTKLKTADLVSEIAQLGTSKVYDYYKGNTKIRLTTITKPEGPIKFMRWDSQKSEASASSGAISTNQLATAASVFSGRPNYPIHFDRLFSGSGNSRAAFETLLAHTPHFFICYPERANPYTGNTEKRLKHIMWCPDREHQLGVIGEEECDQVISEVELGIEFGDIRVTNTMLGDEFDTIEAKKVHTQMQVAMVEIGNALNFRTWIARNDRSIAIGSTQLGKLEGVIQSLDEIPILYSAEIRQAASLIDCIWFSDDFKYMPAVIEVEHSTGVTSGLTRMLKFMNTIPSITTKFTIVAPNELRNKVVSEANNPAFRILRARFMPYSTVRELYGLIKRYSLANVVERNFIEPFMENIAEE